MCLVFMYVQNLERANTGWAVAFRLHALLPPVRSIYGCTCSTKLAAMKALSSQIIISSTGRADVTRRSVSKFM